MMKLGTKTEKAPAENPKRNLPIKITGRFLMQESAQPIIRIRFEACMALSFPQRSAGIPAIIDPIADPSAQIEVIIPFHIFVSSSDFHPKRYSKLICIELYTPIE